MKFLTAKLEGVDGSVVSYVQILPYNTDPEVLLWGGRVFRIKSPGVADADLPVELVPGLDGPRKVIHYVEAWTASAVATIEPDGRAVKVGHAVSALMSPAVRDEPSKPWTLREKAWVEWAERVIGRPGANVSDEELRAEFERVKMVPVEGGEE